MDSGESSALDTATVRRSNIRGGHADGVCVHSDVLGGCLWGVLCQCTSGNDYDKERRKLHLLDCRVSVVCELGIRMVSYLLASRSTISGTDERL